MKRILVAVDGSEPSKNALNMAIDIAQKFGGQLVAVTVNAPVYVPPEPFAATDGELEAALRRYAEDTAKQAADTAKAKGVAAEWRVETGAPAEIIHGLALAWKADLVVVGSRGRGAVTRVLLGSVSSRLAHTCTVPLLIVH